MSREYESAQTLLSVLVLEVFHQKGRATKLGDSSRSILKGEPSKQNPGWGKDHPDTWHPIMAGTEAARQLLILL